ncbi:mitochondrial ATPase inhibitor, IATP-domain-containing protein [Xylaria bambusicola]|uniref:mitochondrial ATPase inhibitor, IATP-domain-containing protein n=1 Tax=Xylaria bambusicola TaxID=326684 RepID=UPI0020072B6D|nr:mitochondrial ATPase inhibitor, IATP-domain-containing protein [Xylaria bambusicola]KAI0514807.1 mitochondrial ATPase inhibitor, IATP-domain-containing protein [Xylaria bambusicola]
MFRQTLTKIPSRGLATPVSRTFSTTLRAMAAGDTGAPPKTGGQGYVNYDLREPAPKYLKTPYAYHLLWNAHTNSRVCEGAHRLDPLLTPALYLLPSHLCNPSTDAFQRREKANEDYAIRQREKEKLMELRKKIAEQKDHLQKLSDHIDELTKEQGGEKN